MQNMPAGLLVRYRETNQYHLEAPHTFGLISYQWLSWVAATEGIFIRHSVNIGEHRLTSNNLLVDGFCQQTNEVFEFMRCFFYVCQRCHVGKGINPLNSKSFQELHQKQEKMKLLEECDHQILVM